MTDLWHLAEVRPDPDASEPSWVVLGDNEIGLEWSMDLYGNDDYTTALRERLNRHSNQIHHLTVRRSVRRQGIGSALLAQFEAGELPSTKPSATAPSARWGHGRSG